MKHVKEEIEVLESEKENIKTKTVIKNKRKRNTRKIYFLTLILLTFMFTTGSFTYALFTTSNIRSNAVSIKTGSLSLSITSSDLNENNQITITPNEEKQITLTISNPNQTAVKYNLYYSANADISDVKIGYTEAGDVAPTTDGTVLAKSNETGYENKIRVNIQNNSDKEVTFTFGVNVGLHNKTLAFPEQKIALAKSDKTFTCKKATKDTLHKETCTYNSTQFCSGAGYTTTGSQKTNEITYGNISETGILKSGDAFDCDVDRDGEYKSDTERFYYVSDIDTNTVSLIYYNNISSGTPSKNTTYPYDTGGNSHTNGPATAVLQLPTTIQWSNVSLTNTIRNITDELDTVKKSNFSYENYAARMLTMKEINQACNITTGSIVAGELDNCTYLMENTKFSTNSNGSYGYWLENVKSDSTQNAWYANGGTYRYINYREVTGADYSLGVRPVIEVSKVNILY